MLTNNDKTIPYRLTQAELVDLRLLRRRTQPSSASEDDVSGEEIAGEVAARESDTVPVSLKVASSTR